jgi:DNA-binding LacI/PurR family transcriptional regulator
VKKATITDVADLAGCSVGTVSAVINGKETVRRETKQRVLKAINQLNFRPTSSAKNLKSGKFGKSIGIVIRALISPFYSEIALGAKEYAIEKGYSLLIQSSEGSHEQEIKAIENLLEKGVQGSVIAPVISENTEIDHLFYLKNINFPFVLLEAINGIQANVVSIDSFSATQQVVQYLVESGYERIIYFAGHYPSSHMKKRTEGFRRGIAESSIVLSDSLIIPTGNTYQEGFTKGLEYFQNRKNKYPMAVVCYNDFVALGLQAALNQLKIKIPDEVAIVGYDDIGYLFFLF